MSILTNLKSNHAVALSFSKEKMTVFMEDGREIGIPLEWFPRLREASKEQLENWRFVGNDEGIRWEDLDEDLLVSELVS